MPQFQSRARFLVPLSRAAVFASSGRQVSVWYRLDVAVTHMIAAAIVLQAPPLDRVMSNTGLQGFLRTRYVPNRLNRLRNDDSASITMHPRGLVGRVRLGVALIGLRFVTFATSPLPLLQPLPNGIYALLRGRAWRITSALRCHRGHPSTQLASPVIVITPSMSYRATSIVARRVMKLVPLVSTYLRHQVINRRLALFGRSHELQWVWPRFDTNVPATLRVLTAA